MKVIYRPATTKDIQSIGPLLRRIMFENDLEGVIPYHEQTSIQTLLDLVASGQGVILLAEKNGTIVGIIAVRKTSVWWSKVQVFINLVFYVIPECRSGGKIQRNLLDRIKIFSDIAKVPILLPIFDNTDKIQKTLKYLNFNGFKTLVASGFYEPKEEK